MKRLQILLISIVLLFLSSCQQKKQQKYSDLLKQTRTKSRQTRAIIVIDPGHGNFDLGTHNDVCEEKVLALNTSLYLKAELIKRGYQVVMTRARDEYVTLKKRAQIANEVKSHVLVSIHYNAASNVDAHGIEVFYPKKATPWKQKRSKLLAQSILKKMLVNTEANSRGVKEGNLCVIRETNMPAVLVECGFITNKEECKKMLNPAYQRTLAKAIAQGLDEYFSS